MSPAAGSSKPQGCSHTFINETVMPSCTTQGYTTHTCSKCGYSYTDAYTAPQHYIGKYLCDYCGAPDPGNPYYSLSAWINTYVPTRDEAGNPNWVYAGPNNASYSITSCQMMSWLLLRYSRMSENGEWESLDIELNDRDQQCTVYYFRRTAAGDYQNGTAVLDRSAVRSPEQLWAAMSVGEEVENDSKEAFLADCSNRMEDVVSTIQNQLLSPQLGFTVDMLGLTA